MSAGSSLPASVVVIGAGPAGLMAAEGLAERGWSVDVYDAMRSVGRKFLRAGVGGLNLTHAEPAEAFRGRFGAASTTVRRWLDGFDACAVRDWAQELGVATFVGSSGRVFPVDFKAAPLLRAWLQRLRGKGVRIHTQQRWLGWTADGSELCFSDGSQHWQRPAAACVLALGGGSWPQLGSDGAWCPELSRRGVALAPLQPANCGFNVGWSARLREQYAGTALKPVVLQWTDESGVTQAQQGELMLSEYGLEGGLLYAHSAALRDQIARQGHAEITLDLLPGRSLAAVQAALQQRPERLSWPKWLQRAGLQPVHIALLHEAGARPGLSSAADLAGLSKALPLRLVSPRPLAEAISSAGGVRCSELDAREMLRQLPGVFCAGEMIDWEAPTGGYLLTACLASGRACAAGVDAWLRDCSQASH